MYFTSILSIYNISLWNCGCDSSLTRCSYIQAGDEPSESLDVAIEKMCKKTRDLRKQLRKAVVDHVSDSFLETNVPLLILIEAAKAGNEAEVSDTYT